LPDNEELAKRIADLFSKQKLAVLSTHDHGQPYASLVGFAASKDLKHLLFATPRQTRKCTNLKNEPRSALLIDSRSNQDSDFHDAIAATAVGRAAEVLGPERDAWVQVYLAKHPHLAEFIGAPTCALFRLEVDTYYVVEHFQHILELHVKR
jgi:nitroimidazol reductase NimA-like FMN-containing flavoprotein (pyridoxamine 5'-phosphate oxidase superfamily)